MPTFPTPTRSGFISYTHPTMDNHAKKRYRPTQKSKQVSATMLQRILPILTPTPASIITRAQRTQCAPFPFPFPFPYISTPCILSGVGLAFLTGGLRICGVRCGLRL